LMMGVDHNRNMEWVGASAGLWGGVTKRGGIERVQWWRGRV
jgi:hypothetical protein